MFSSIQTLGMLLAMPAMLITAVLSAADPEALRYWAEPTTVSTQQIMRGASGKVKKMCPSRQPQPIVGDHFVVEDHFLGAQKQESAQINIDTSGAVGPEQFLLFIKGRARTFNKKTKQPDGVLDTVLENFFASVSGGYFISDPRCLFDAHSNRWIVAAIIGGQGFDNDEENNADQVQATKKQPSVHANLSQISPPASVLPYHGFFLAVSDTSVITPDTVWTIYTIDNQNERPEVSFFDFDTLAVDEDAIYMGANVILTGLEAFTGSDSAVYVIQKASVLNGGAAFISAFYGLTSQFNMFTPQGATNFDTGSHVGYVLSVDPSNSRHVLLSQVINPGSFAPQLTAPIAVPVPRIFGVINVPALGSNEPIGATVGDRFTSAPHIRNNKLWAVIDIGMDATGHRPSNPANISRVGAGYFMINLSNPTVVAQSGSLYDPTTTAPPRSYYFNSIMTNSDGRVFIGSTVSGEAERLNAAISLLLDNASNFETILYTNCTTDFNPTDDIRILGQYRWGDYSLITPDPTEPGKVWVVEEYCYNTDTWGVEIAEVSPIP